MATSPLRRGRGSLDEKQPLKNGNDDIILGAGEKNGLFEKGKEKCEEDDDEFSHFEVRIVNTTNRLDASFSQFAVYNLDIKFGGKKWRVSRRFSQFVELHQQLKEAFPKGEVPSLPQKFAIFRSSTNKHLVKERMEELNKYLQALASRECFAKNPIFIQWLSPDHDPSFVPSASASAMHTGWLWKQGHLRKNWKWRWFVLKSQFLFYFKNKQSFQPLGAIPLRSCVVEWSKLKENCVKLEPDPKCQPFFIRTENEEDIAIWFKKLRKVSSVYGQTKKKNVPLSAILSVAPMTPELRRRGAHGPRASCVIGKEPRSAARSTTAPNFPPVRPKSSSPRPSRQFPPPQPTSQSPPQSASQTLPQSLPQSFPHSLPQSPQSSPKFMSSSNTSGIAFCPKSIDSKGSFSALPERRGSFGSPSRARSATTRDDLMDCRPYVPRNSYSVAPSVISEEVMSQMLEAKENIDRELSIFQLKISELLKEGGLSESDQVIMEQVRDLVDEMCRLSISDLLEEGKCETMIHQLQNDIVKLSEGREFPTMMLILLSPFSRLLYTYKAAKGAKTMHEVEEIASIGCHLETESPQQRLSATDGVYRSHRMSSLSSSLSGSFPSPKVSPNILHSRVSQSMKDLPPKIELESLELVESLELNKQEEPKDKQKREAISSRFMEQYSSSFDCKKIENEDFSFLPRVHTDSKRPFLSTCVMLVSAFCAGGAGILVEESKKGELVSSIADFAFLEAPIEEEKGDPPNELEHASLSDSFAEKMAIVGDCGSPPSESPAELVHRFSSSQPEKLTEEAGVEDVEEFAVLCRVCDQQFSKKMVDQHAKYCSKVRGIERKFEISSNEILAQLEEEVKARLSELEELDEQSEDSVRKCEVLEQMSQILSRLQRVEKEATGASHYRSVFAQIEEDMKKLKIGTSFNKSCESPDAAIDPFSYLLSRILSEKKASLSDTIRKELKKPHLFGLEKFCDDPKESGVEGEAVSEPKVTIHDFEMVKPISSGAFGKVWLARKTKSGDLYAVKIIRKSDMVRKNMQEHVSNERNVMELASNNPFLVDFFYAFQSDDHVYLVMEFIQGGDCGSLLENVGYLEEAMARHYIAEVVLALEYLHSMNIVHRDLKPDNMLVTVDGHIKLTDFGLSFVGAEVLSMSRSDASGRHRVVGTPDYISPEALMGTGYGPSVDWWALGIVLFELLVGFPPFNDESPTHIFQNILKKEICWPLPPDELSPDAKDLIERLLTTEPADRLGANGASEVKKHPFFNGLDWDNLLGTKLMFQPEVDNELDTGYFVPHSSLSMSLVGNFQRSDGPATGTDTETDVERSEGSDEEESTGLSKFNLPNFSYINFDGLAHLTKAQSARK